VLCLIALSSSTSFYSAVCKQCKPQSKCYFQLISNYMQIADSSLLLRYSRRVLRYFFDVAARSAEEGDSTIVDCGQRHRGQWSAGKHDPRPRFQRISANQRSVLLDLAAVARVDLNSLHTTSRLNADRLHQRPYKTNTLN